MTRADNFKSWLLLEIYIKSSHICIQLIIEHLFQRQIILYLFFSLGNLVTSMFILLLRLYVKEREICTSCYIFRFLKGKFLCVSISKEMLSQCLFWRIYVNVSILCAVILKDISIEDFDFSVIIFIGYRFSFNCFYLRTYIKFIDACLSIIIEDLCERPIDFTSSLLLRFYVNGSEDLCPWMFLVGVMSLIRDIYGSCGVFHSFFNWELPLKAFFLLYHWT